MSSGDNSYNDWQSGYDIYNPAPSSAPAQNAQAVVEQMYQDILGRAPDPGGLQAFTDAINNGADIGALAQSIASSPEAINRIQSGQATASSVAAAAAAAGEPNYVAQAASNQVNEDYVTALYQTVLGRAPDAGGLANNLALLRSGAITPEGLAQSFAASPEAKSNNIPGSLEQQMAQYMAQSYGQTGSRNIDTATGNWTGVTPGQLINAGIKNPAILAAAANGTLNDNIFGAYKVDANKVADALNAGRSVPTDVTQTLNSQTTNAYTPNGQVTSMKAAGGGQTVYYYSDGSTALYNANGTIDHITPPAGVYKQQAGSMAYTDNPGMAYFNGQLVRVETPTLQWDPSKGKVAQDTKTGAPAVYDPGPQGGGIGGALANFDSAVRNTIPGGWYTVGAVALAAATWGASTGLTATSQAAAAMDMAGMTGSVASGGLGMSAAEAAAIVANQYGISIEAATAMAQAGATTAAASAGGTTFGSTILAQMGLEPTLTNALITIGQGSLTGAGMGGVSAALTGGDIGKGLLTGAITGVVTGGVNMGLSGLGPVALTQAAAGVAGGATNAMLNGGSIAQGALSGGVAGGVGSYLSGSQYANWAKEVGGAAGGVVGALISGNNIMYSAVSGAALGGIGGLISSGVLAATNPLLDYQTLGSHTDANGNKVWTEDSGATFTVDADGKIISYTPPYQTLTFDEPGGIGQSTLTFDPTTGEIVSATDWNGDVIKTQDVPAWVKAQFGNTGLNNSDLTATVMAGVMAPKVGTQLQKIIGGLTPKPGNPAPGTPDYGLITPVKFGNGQTLNFGGMNPDFLKKYNWDTWGTHQALPEFDPNAFTKMYMQQPNNTEWSQGVSKQNAQYVPTPFVPKTAAQYSPNQIFGPSGQPGSPTVPVAQPAVPVAQSVPHPAIAMPQATGMYGGTPLAPVAPTIYGTPPAYTPVLNEPILNAPTGAVAP